MNIQVNSFIKTCFVESSKKSFLSTHVRKKSSKLIDYVCNWISVTSISYPRRLKVILYVQLYSERIHDSPLNTVYGVFSISHNFFLWISSSAGRKHNPRFRYLIQVLVVVFAHNIHTRRRILSSTLGIQLGYQQRGFLGFVGFM